MINIKFPITKSFQSTKKSGAKDIIFNIAIENGKEVPIVKLKSGHVYTLYGNNGIGKTTFMNILSLLTESNEPYYHSEGQFYYGFTDGKTTDEISHSKSRYKYFSFIFQDPHIINMYTLEENMKIVNPEFNYTDDLKMIKENVSKLEIRQKSKETLGRKIDKFLDAKDNTPYYLSGGEKQLFSFMRALIKPSHILFADEPWASMDTYIKEFIEMQLYKYLDNEDLFNSIRKRSLDLAPQNIAIIISHPTQNREGDVEGASKIVKLKIKKWTKEIPVTNNPGEIPTEATPRLNLERYDKL